MLLSGYVSSNGTGQDIEPELIQAGGRKDYILLRVKIFAQLAETLCLPTGCFTYYDTGGTWTVILSRRKSL